MKIRVIVEVFIIFVFIIVALLVTLARSGSSMRTAEQSLKAEEYIRRGDKLYNTGIEGIKRCSSRILGSTKGKFQYA